MWIDGANYTLVCDDIGGAEINRDGNVIGKRNRRLTDVEWGD